MKESTSTRAAVVLLSAQTLAFGVAVALLVIPATSIFLHAYGSEWLPVTYIAVAIVGGTTSWLMARAVRRFRLVAVATVALGAQVVLFAAGWVALEYGGQWVSAPLLVMFPLALQMGFVFVGGQAGRVLDVRQLKELFPRIVSGFVIGFFVGGLAGAPLLALREEPQDLLLGAAAAQFVFVALLIVTDRRFPSVRETSAPDAGDADGSVPRRVPLRAVLASRLIAVIFAYQLLSALGSQFVDYLMFDRAAYRYPDEADLTRWVTLFTAIVNLVDILVLVLVAGYLLKRFGLRFGLIANPAAVGLAFVALLVVGVGPGTASLGFLTLTAVTRIIDIVLTDSATRTSINATYQVIPLEERLAVQTTIEGIGVPAAIGVAGVILLVLQALPGGTMAVVIVSIVVAILWTAAGWIATREYAAGLRRVIVERTLVDAPIDLTDVQEADALDRLLRSDDGRQVALGLDLLAGLTSPAPDSELRRLLDDDEPEVQLGALAELTGNERLSTLSRTDAAIVMAELDGDRDLRSPVTLGVIRACRDLPPDLAVERLTRHIGDSDRAVGAVVLAALADADAGESPELVEAIRATMRADGEHAVRIIAVGRALALDPGEPLRRALDDEFELLQSRALSILIIRHGDVARRAVRAFAGRGDDGKRRALAIETLEVTAGRDDVVALTLVRPDLDDDGRLRALGGSDRVLSVADVTADLIDDPNRVWRSEWIAACAAHHQEHSRLGGEIRR